MSFNEWLASLNIDAASLSDTRRTALESAWRTETGELPPPLPAPRASGGTADPDSVFNDVVNKSKANQARKAAIAEACSKLIDARPTHTEGIAEVGTLAMEQGWTVERTELELLRRFERSNAVIPTRSQAPAIDNKLMEVALMTASAVPGVEKMYDERTLQRANDQFGARGISVGEMLSMAARQSGWRGHSFGGDIENALKYAFANDNGHGPRSSGGVPSTYSIPTILSNVANKSLKVYFESIDQSWRLISGIGSARDFKQTTDVALSGSLLFEDLGKGQEIKHGTIADEVYNNQVGTKALMLGLDRQDLINDDAGALQSVMRRLGRGAALKFNYDFWTTFLGASSAFFDSSLGNAGSTALGATGLDTANALFANLTDPDGQFMGSTAKILLVGPGLAATAKTLMGSTLMNHTGDTDAVFGSDNPWAGMFTVVTNPYVGSTAYGGASTRWYLLADPADIPTIETKFLNGNQTPTIEQTTMNFNLLGISMRGWFDYGVALQERRGGVKEN